MNRNTVLLVLFTTGILSVHLSNIWRLDTYPFTDLPNHLAEAYLFRVLPHADEPLREYYRVAATFFTPASLHMVFCAAFPDVETGNRAFYTLYVLFLSLGMLLLVSRAGGDLWVGLLGTLALYNYGMMWGFAGFTMGIALTPLAMVCLALYAEKPSAHRGLPLAIIAVVLYYSHVLVFAFVSAVIAVVILSRAGFPIRRRLLGLAVLLPGMLLLATWVCRSPYFGNTGHESTLAFLRSYYRHEYLSTVLPRLARVLTNDNPVTTWRWWRSPVAPALCSLLAIGLIVAIRSRRGGVNAQATCSGSRHAALVLLVAGAACYFLLPERLPGLSCLYGRFSVFALLGGVCLLSFLVPGRIRPLVHVAVVLLVTIHSGLWFHYFSEFKKAAEPFRSLLYRSPLATERSLAAVIEDSMFRSTAAFIHYQNYQLIWNHGVVPTKITEYRFQMIQQQEQRRLPVYHEWLDAIGDYRRLLGGYKGMELMLCRGSDELLDALTESGYVLIARRDKWRLFRKGSPG